MHYHKQMSRGGQGKRAITATNLPVDKLWAVCKEKRPTHFIHNSSPPININIQSLCSQLPTS